jgi:PAS domain S-box-containing protein
VTTADKSRYKYRLLSRQGLVMGLVILALAVAYAVLFPWLIKTFGSLTRAFSLSFVLLAAWQWGLWGGVAASIGNLALNMVLHHLAGQTMSGGPLGVIIAMSLAVVVGRLSDVTRRLKEQLSVKTRAEVELAAHRDRLEEEVQVRTSALTEAKDRLEQEIAERLRTEDALRQSEEKYRLVVENAAEAIVVIQGGRIMFANLQAARMTDQTQKELVDRSFIEFIHPEDRDLVVERHRRRLAGEQVPSTYDFRIVAPARGTLWVEVAVVSVTWEGQPATLNFLSNVTERRATEVALRESERRFRELAELMPQTVFEVDAGGRLTFVNQGAFDQFGYGPEDLARGLIAFDLVAPEERDRAVANARKVLSGQNIGQNEYLFKRRDGTAFPAILHSNPIQRDGQIVGLRGFIIDITERKRAEDALKASEEMFQTAFRFIPDWVSISTVDEGRYLDVNEAYCQGTGWQREEVLGKTSTEIGLWADPEDRRRGARTIERHGHLHQMEVNFRRKGGQEIVALWSAAPVTIGGRDCLISVVQDITERKQAEQSLRASEERFRDLFESISDLVYTQDLEGRFTSVNPALADLFGYEPEDLVGHRASEFMKPEFKEAFETEYLGTLEAVGHHEGTSVYHRANGHRRYIEYRSHLVRPEGGQPYISGIGLDVTERIRAEKQLQALQDQLLQSQKMEAVGTLASGIAHDFNNILHAVSGYLELLTTRPQDIPPDHRYLIEINQLTERAAELVRRLLTFSRKVESRLEPVDLNREVIQTVKMLERTIPKMIRIETDLASDLYLVRGDLTQIEQVIMNLGANAKDAMPAGGLLTIETRNTFLDEKYCRSQVEVSPGQYVRLRVADTGHGMDSHTVQHIFEPFFTTKEIGHGTGLGLSTVYGVIKAHGGHLTCASRPDRGTTFDIFLPALLEAVDLDADRTEDDTPAPGGNETVLLVDDDRAILDIAQDILAEHGYTALQAASGEEALEIYSGQSREIDLVILDLNMPGMGGRACLEALIEVDPGIRVLVASGYSAGGTEESVLEAGAVGFVGKPFRLQDLLRRVRQALDQAV